MFSNATNMTLVATERLRCLTMYLSYYRNISNECSLFSSFSQWTCVCKCLDLFGCSQATSGRIVTCKSVEEILVYSTIINQRARERSWTSQQLQWPEAKNPKEKYPYPQLNVIQSVTMVTVNKGDLSQGDLVLFHTQQYVGCDVQLSLNAMLSQPLRGAAREYSLPFTASIKSHLSTFFSAHQYTELRASNLLPPYQLQTYCIEWKMGLKCAVIWQMLSICLWGNCLFLHWMVKVWQYWWCRICSWLLK